MPEYIKPMIRIDQYEKLVDDVFIIGHNVVLRLNVILNKYSDKYGRRSYHQEFEYFNKNAHSNTITLRRDFDYYLSIENIVAEDDLPKQFIMLTVSDMIGFSMFIADIIKWFEDKEFMGLYVFKDQNLIMTKQVKPVIINLSSGRSYIMAEPIVYTDRFNNEELGVRLYLSSELIYSEVPLSRIKGLQYLIAKMDLYGCACALINYLQRPELGSNLTSYSSVSTQRNAEDSIPSSPSAGRRIQDKKMNLSDL